ncbi:hypothetical protein BC831DRAFT_466817 [Entophlyctis helioformis]|nr:hypothetical protein BC831DRAFT_466817 [Entophlyctis helioformis]
MDDEADQQQQQQRWRVSDAAWAQVSLHRPETASRPVPPARTPKPAPSSAAVAAAAVTVKRRDNRKDLDKCSLDDLLMMADHSSALLANSAMVQALPDQGAKLHARHQDILARIDSFKQTLQASSASVSSTVSADTTEIETMLDRLSVATGTTPAKDAGQQPAAATKTTAADRHGKTGRIRLLSVAESVAVLERRRRELDESRLRDAMEKLAASSERIPGRPLHARTKRGAGAAVVVVGGGGDPDEADERQRNADARGVRAGLSKPLAAFGEYRNGGDRRGGGGDGMLDLEDEDHSDALSDGSDLEHFPDDE